MKIVEHFLSIQGEGAFAGRLAIFIRFAGCNLRCAGFGVKSQSQLDGSTLVGCDTIRAVHISHFSYKDLSYNDLKEIVLGYTKTSKSTHLPLVVITGGEPLLHHDNDEFINLIKWLLDFGYDVHFETNGTINIDFNRLSFYKRCCFAVSVKLSISKEPIHKRLNEKAIKSIESNTVGSFFKFVLSSADEIKEIQSIVSISPSLPVWLMPLGHNESMLNKNAPTVALLAIKNGYNYSDRLHIRLWGDKEGV